MITPTISLLWMKMKRTWISVFYLFLIFALSFHYRLWQKKRKDKELWFCSYIQNKISFFLKEMKTNRKNKINVLHRLSCLSLSLSLSRLFVHVTFLFRSWQWNLLGVSFDNFSIFVSLLSIYRCIVSKDD